MKLGFLLRRRSFKGIVLLILIILPGLILAAVDGRKMSLEEAIQEISAQYGVYFSYNKKLIENHTVDFEFDYSQPLNKALEKVLVKTNLKYRIHSEKYVIIYSRDREGIQSLKEMAKHLEKLIDIEEKRKESITTFLPSKSLEIDNSFEEKRVVINLTGVVTNAAGEPLIGVNVLVKGTDKGTATDFDGRFVLKDIDEKAIIVLSYIGYQTREVEVNGKSEIDIVLIEDSQTLDELIVVGYGTVKKSDLTGSVERIDAESFRNQSMTQLTDMLTGTVAGFSANQGTSAAGGSSMQIRGPNSLNASTEPMVVLDGVIYNGSISDINPKDIKTIDILKDASSAAIFGARAASGVILITTVKGEKGKPVINFSGNFGFAEASNKSHGVRSPQDYLTMRRDFLATDEDRSEPSYYWYSPDDLPEGITLEQWRNAGNNPDTDNTKEWLNRLNFWPTEVENYLAGNTVDWSEEVLQVGLRQEANLSIGGGSDNANYYWSLGYVDNEGVIKGDQYTNIRMRLNVEFDITDWLNVGGNFQYSNQDQGGVSSSLTAMQRASPYGNIYEDDGSLQWYPNDYILATNPLINYYGQERDNTLSNLFGTVFANVELPFDIQYKISFQPRIENYRDYNFWSPETIIGSQIYPGGRSTRTDFSSYEWMIDNILKWNKEFGSHVLDVTLLYNGEFNRSWITNSANQTFNPSSVLGYSGIQFGTSPSVNANDSKITGDALMARLNYSLLDKYLLTTSIRRDGYSAFGQENPRAIFPAAALAWRISGEEFFSINFISHLKARMSWGKNGNREIGAYSSLAQMSSNQYYNGSIVRQGIYTSTLSNSGLQWEVTESINLGVDIGLFENRINFSVDYYDMNTSNLLVNRTLPKITGFESITTNIGKLANKGFEFTFNSNNINSKNFYWKTSANFSLNRNEIKSLFGDVGEYVVEGQIYTGEIPDYTNKWFPGHAIDEIWDYDIVGIWQLDEADAAYEYTLFPGDFKAVDQDGNGAYEALQDKTFIGYTQPRFRIGLRNEFSLFKDFNLSIFLRADLGHKKQFTESINSSGKGAFVSLSTTDYPYWSLENPTNEWPKLYTRTAPFGGGIAFFKPASFLRIQDISLSYDLSNKFKNLTQIIDFRLFCSVRNLAVLNSWQGWDPESENTPMPRIYNFGFNISI